MTANEFYLEGMAIMKKHSLVKVERDVHPKYFLTHIENRDKLMLNAKQVHNKGKVIANIGADRNQLSTAIAVEIAPSGPTRVANLEANRKLIEKSNGLLAPMNGQELYLSLGCGHTVAFCKVAPLCGPTPEKTLQDEHGALDCARLQKQSEFKAMMEIGWAWEIIPWDVDAMFPKFAKKCQKALNGSNSASSEIGELDTAMALSDLQTELSAETESWEKLAIKTVQGSQMSCGEYATVILDFVKMYGGGPGAPHISFMDAIGKKYNSTMVLGAEFWKAMTYTQFPDKTNMYPLLRVALGLVNLTADPANKILAKGDVQKLATQKHIAKAREAELILGQALEICTILEQNGTKKDDILEALGQLFVRIGLAATEKGSKGAEGKDWSIGEIKKLYIDACSKVVGTKVNFEDWGDVVLPAAKPAPAPAASKAQQSPASLHDHNSATWIAQSKGFEVGSVIKESSRANQKFVIVSIDDASTEIQLREVVTYDGAAVPFLGTVTLEELLSTWSKASYVEPVKSIYGEIRPASLEVDRARANLFQALMDADEEKKGQVAALKLEFWRKPDMIRTSGESIAKGKLTLVPMLSLNQIGTKPGGVSFGVQKINDTSIELWGSGSPISAADKLNADEHLNAAFWWVQTTSDSAKVNMELQSTTINNMKIPVLKNIQAIPAYTQLLRFKAAPAAKASTLKASRGTPSPETKNAQKKCRKSS